MGVTPWRRRAVRATVALVMLLIAGIALENAGEALVVAAPLENPQAIIALGSHEWERLPAAAEEAHRTPEALVFITQPKVPTVHNCHDCANRIERLVAAGIDRARVVMLPEVVSNTRDEAAAALAECDRRGLHRLLVVTSPYHTRRARRIFDRAFRGREIQLGIVGAGSYSPARPEVWWKAPYDRAYVRYEWAALAYDTLRPARDR